MNDRVGELISSFRHATATGRESAGKIEAISELKRHDDPRVTSFLVQIAGSPSEYDLARIEALKALELGEVDPDDRHVVFGMIREVLAHDEDDDVRSYAARALAGFTELPGVLEVAVERVLDQDEDEDVRHNAFLALERSEPTESAVSLMERCRDDEDFREGAIRVLDRWRRVGR